VLDNVIENENVTRALYDEGIDNIINLVKMRDDIVNNLTYCNPKSNIHIKLEMGPIFRIKSFIHYVHFCGETNPIGNDWKSITMDDFYQFICNLKYVCRFASLSSLTPLDMMYFDDEPNLLDVSELLNEINVLDVTDVYDAPNYLDVSDVLDESDIFIATDDLDVSDIFSVTDVLDVTDIIEATYSINVIDVTIVLDVGDITDVIGISDDVLDESFIFSATDDLDVSDIFSVTDVLDGTDIIEATYSNSVIDVTIVLDVGDITDVISISDDSFDLSSTSDISQVTTTDEVLKVYHQVDMKYHPNGSPVLSIGLTPCPSRPPRKPPYSKQCGTTNLHDILPY
jgi:hypothetical protein